MENMGKYGRKQLFNVGFIVFIAGETIQLNGFLWQIFTTKPWWKRPLGRSALLTKGGWTSVALRIPTCNWPKLEINMECIYNVICYHIGNYINYIIIWCLQITADIWVVKSSWQTCPCALQSIHLPIKHQAVQSSSLCAQSPSPNSERTQFSSLMTPQDASVRVLKSACFT